MHFSKQLIINCFLLTVAVITAGCVANTTFEKTITIDASADCIFEIITDYESYATLLPMLHDSVTIVSQQKKGPGVVWKSTGSFKSHKFTSEWTVTEFVENRKVEMKDLKEKIGETVLELTPVSDTRTEYKMYLMTKMYKPFEAEFIEIYNKEMSIIKEESEKRYKDR